MARLVALLAAAVAVLAATPVFAARSDTLTVSGISAGAAFAVQYEIAHSSKVRSAGVIAGLPWWCAKDELANALMCMDDSGTIDLDSIYSMMKYSESLGQIDKMSNVGKHAVMLFSGIIDTVVSHGSMIALAEQYNQLNVSQDSTTSPLITYFNYTAEHSWITNSWGNACSHLGSPYVNNCHLDFAGEFFKMAWKHMSLPFNTTKGAYNSTNMRKFNQGSFGADGFLNSMASTGFYYVPTQCQGSGHTKCHIHLNLHGCTQQIGVIGDEYVSHTGLNEWAETNDVIVVYPQTAANALKENPKGCFDWWGYDDSEYATKEGTQMKIIDAIVQHVTANGNLPAQW